MDNPKERKVKFSLYKLSWYALDWWEWIQHHRIWLGKDKICSLSKMLTIEFFPLFFYDVIVSYAKQNYRSISSDANYIDEFCIQQSREDVKLGINNIEPSFEEKF